MKLHFDRHGRGEAPRHAARPALTLKQAQDLPEVQLRPSYVQRHCGLHSPLRRIAGIGDHGVLGVWVLLECGHWREIRDYHLAAALGRKSPQHARCGCCRLHYLPAAADEIRAHGLLCQYENNPPDITGPNFSDQQPGGSQHVR